jgi:hypothetical protein
LEVIENMALQALIQGYSGELKTRLAQKLFLDSEQYHVFNNIIIQSEYRSTQIDHVIVSKYGIFVVETKNKDGWIYGSSNDEQWTQVFYQKKFKLQNPLWQNYLHTRSLAEFLGIDHGKMHSVVIFWGKCQFKTQMPKNVLNKNYTGYIKSKKQILLSIDEVNRICDKLLMLQHNTPFLVGWHHSSSLKKRYESSTTCPKCGGSLLERTAHTGKGTGQKFLGCKNYPRCRYTKEL